jgi:hypothetical protein
MVESTPDNEVFHHMAEGPVAYLAVIVMEKKWGVAVGNSDIIDR